MALSSIYFQVPVKCVQQKLYVRISAHIYNEMSEYMTLRDAVRDIEQSNKEETCQNK
jgi:hypothetical protein